MTNLGKAIDFDVLRDVKVFTFGVRVPFLSRYLATRSATQIERIFENEVANDLEFENQRIMSNLAMRQIMYRGMRHILENARYDSDEYKATVNDFKAVFFVEFNEDIHFDMLDEKIAQIDAKIDMMLQSVANSNDESKDIGLFTVVAWVEDVLNREMNRKMSLNVFARYYERALLTHKQNTRNGESN